MYPQRAADNDVCRTAVSRACASQSIATIGPTNLTHVKKLYTPTVPSLGYPHPSSFPTHQTYSLPGNMCDTIRHVARNKDAGVNADSINLFLSLLNALSQQYPRAFNFYLTSYTRTAYQKTSSDTSQMFIYFSSIKIHLIPQSYDPSECPLPFDVL